jgi:DNA-binding transcriptional ArsR family regulator
LQLSGNDQFKALADPLRRRIIDLATERPATVAEFATALNRPPGTIAHHVKLLASAGLLAVVGTRQVRSVTEHYYGRTAPTFVMPNAEEREAQMVEDLGRTRRRARPGEASFLGVRFLRLPDDRAGALVEEFIGRLEALAEESGEGDTVYGVMLGIVPTVHTGLPPNDTHP